MRARVLTVLVLSTAALPFVPFACGGSAAPLGNPLDTRETPPSSYDQPPSSEDTPPSQNEGSPPTADSPPSTTDTANQTGAMACLPCSGTFSCTAPGGSGPDTVVFEVLDGKCNIGVAGEGMAALPPLGGCGTGIPLSFTAGGTVVKITRTSGGGFVFCDDSDAGDQCSSCTAEAGSTPAGQGSGSGSASSTNTVNIGATSTGGADCSTLSSCCSKLSGLEASDCSDIASSGNDTECADSLSTFEALCD